MVCISCVSVFVFCEWKKDCEKHTQNKSTDRQTDKQKDRNNILADIGILIIYLFIYIHGLYFFEEIQSWHRYKWIFWIFFLFLFFSFVEMEMNFSLAQNSPNHWFLNEFFIFIFFSFTYHDHHTTDPINDDKNKPIKNYRYSKDLYFNWDSIYYSIKIYLLWLSSSSVFVIKFNGLCAEKKNK